MVSVLESMKARNIQRGMFFRGGVDLVMVDTEERFLRLEAKHKPFGTILHPSPLNNNTVKFVQEKK